MIKINPDLLYIDIKDDNQLEDLLKEYSLIKYVGSHLNTKEIENWHPILEDCYAPDYNTYSSQKMNEFIGYDLFNSQCKLSSFNINLFLNIYYNKRGYAL